MTSPQITSSVEDCNESPAYHRNPSPPKEVIGLSDNIGHTAFSRHWLFTTLMKLIKVIEKPFEKLETDKDDAKNGALADKDDDTVTKDAGEDGSPAADATSDTRDRLTSVDHKAIDISDNLQDELCQLWDMSSDEDVAKLLHEFKAIDILTEVISKSDAPRATEIAVGILGNMACTSSVCEAMSANTALVDLSLRMLTNTDVPTLVELTRFLSTVLSNSKCRVVWMKEWSSNTHTRDNIVFILHSSVNKDLIKNTANLLDTLLDLSDDLCNEWSTPDLLTAIVEALQQIGLYPEEGTCSLLHSMQLMSTQTNGAAAIIDMVELTTDVLLDFLLTVCEDEIVNLEGTRSAAVASVISVLDTILMSSPAGYSLLYSSEKCIRCVLKVIYACDKEMVVMSTPRNTAACERNSNSSNTPTSRRDNNSKLTPKQPVNNSQGNEQLIETLRDTLYTLLYDTMHVMKKEEVDVSQSCPDAEEESAAKSDNGKTIPSVLKYMDRDCERARISSLVSLVLTHDSGHELIEQILQLVDKYELDRLSSVVLDCLPSAAETDSSSNSSVSSPRSPS